MFAVEHIKGHELEAMFFSQVDRPSDASSMDVHTHLYVGATRAATYFGTTGSARSCRTASRRWRPCSPPSGRRRDTEKPGMRLAPVRASRESGHYLGYLLFERFAETGLHQHLGPAFGYFLQGGLAGYQGVAREGEMGINLEGATHSAIAYAPTLAASCLEAPVIYPSEDSVRGETLHTGARAGGIVNAAPEVMPDILVPLDALPWQGTLLAGLQRRLVFDYRQTAFARRNAQLRLLPSTRLPAFETTAPLDLFVIGGDLDISGERVGAGGFLVVDEGAQVAMGTQHGCLCLAWSEDPVRWSDREGPDPFGF